MADIGDIAHEYVLKKRQFEIDNNVLKNKGNELRIMELKQEIKRVELEMEIIEAKIKDLQNTVNK